MLAHQRALLAAHGTAWCAVPNLQHHSVLRQLVRGVFPYGAHPCSTRRYVRLFTSAGIMQLLLDAGYAPDTVDRVEDSDGDDLQRVGAPLFELWAWGRRTPSATCAPSS